MLEWGGFFSSNSPLVLKSVGTKSRVLKALGPIIEFDYWLSTEGVEALSFRCSTFNRDETWHKYTVYFKIALIFWQASIHLFYGIIKT